MTKSVLTGKRILAVDDEPDILDILREELERYRVDVDTAGSYEEAIQKMHSFTYDLAILDIMGVRGFELLQYAMLKGLPTVMLTAHALTLESLRKAIDLGARAYLPKTEMMNIGLFLEDVLTLNYQATWKSLFSKLGDFFGQHFGPEWRKSEKEFLERFDHESEVSKPTIIE
jgi:CheY-like chemotaxis protein